MVTSLCSHVREFWSASDLFVPINEKIREDTQLILFLYKRKFINQDLMMLSYRVLDISVTGLQWISVVVYLSQTKSLACGCTCWGKISWNLAHLDLDLDILHKIESF